MQASAASKTTASDWGALMLRLALGVLFLAHSVVLKIVTYGFDGTAKFFVSVGLPAWLVCREPIRRATTRPMRLRSP